MQDPSKQLEMSKTCFAFLLHLGRCEIYALCDACTVSWTKVHAVRRCRDVSEDAEAAQDERDRASV